MIEGLKDLNQSIDFVKSDIKQINEQIYENIKQNKQLNIKDISSNFEKLSIPKFSHSLAELNSEKSFNSIPDLYPIPKLDLKESKKTISSSLASSKSTFSEISLFDLALHKKPNNTE